MKTTKLIEKKRSKPAKECQKVTHCNDFIYLTFYKRQNDPIVQWSGVAGRHDYTRLTQGNF